MPGAAEPATKHVRREEEEEYTPSTTTNATIQAAEASIAAFTPSIAKLEKELEEAKVKMKKWSANVEDPSYANPGFAVEREAFYQAAVDKAQAAVDKAQAALLAEKKLLDNAQQRQQELLLLLEKKKLNAQDAPLSFDTAFEKLNVKFPESIDKFEPKLVQIDKSHPFAESMTQAGVLGSFSDPTKPNFLLTEMSKQSLDKSFLRSLKVQEDGKLVEEEGGIIIDNWHIIVLIGTSGAGKTLYTYKLAKMEPTVLFVCDRKGNGGSGDIEWIINKAKSLENQGNITVSVFMQDNIRKAVAFRMRLYGMCRKKYGENFKPHHWAMAQLYPLCIFGEDIFLTFQELNVALRSEANVFTEIRRIVLDEAQVMDAVLPKFFPSDQGQKTLCRSLLSPCVKALATLDPKLLICGTGLSTTNVYSTVVSPIKLGVGRSLVGMSKYFTSEDVVQVLEGWGIPKTSVTPDWAATFVGRPRHAAFLAQALFSGNVNVAVSDISLKYRNAVPNTRLIDVETSQKSADGTSNVTGNASLYTSLWNAALDWLLGGSGLFDKQATVAIMYGMASLGQIDNRLCCVVREPLLLMGILGSDPAAVYEKPIPGSAEEVGYSLENYLGLRADKLVGDLREILRTTEEEGFNRDWEFSFTPNYTQQRGFRALKCGDEVEWLQRALDPQKPPCNTVCLPEKTMGPDVIICAHAKDDPKTRLVVLIQAKSGVDVSTPSAFKSLEFLYSDKRDSKEPKTTGGCDIHKESVDAMLKECKVVHLVVKPMNGSRCKPVEKVGEIVKIVLDSNSRNLFPDVAAGIQSVVDAKEKAALPLAKLNLG